MLKVFYSYLKYELIILLRNRADWIQPILLYMLTIALFGFCLSQNSQALSQIAGVVLWLAILYSMLTLSEHMIRKDLEEGWLDQVKLSPYPLWLFLLSKSLAYGALINLGLLASLPIIGIWLSFSLKTLLGLSLIYLVSIPGLILLLLFGLSLTVGLPKPGLLLGILLFPLCIPVLILGQSAILNLQDHHWPAFESALLGAFTIMATLILPPLSAFSLNQSGEE